MKIKYFVYALLAIALTAFIIYRIIENAPEDDAKTPQKTAPLVDAIVLQHSDFADNLSLSGSIEANEQVEIRSEASGIVEKIMFTEGTRVSKGQPLFQVNDLELRAQLGKVSTAQGLASENARRAKLLLEKEAISQEEYDMAAAELQSARSETSLIRAQLAKSTIRAPFSGIIGLRNISRGAYVTPATLVATLVNSSDVKITFSLPEKYARQFDKGSTVSFTIAGSKKNYKAKVYAIEPGIDVATRTLKVRALADNDAGELIPGTFANVSLPLAKIDDAILVPSQALIPIQNGKKVFVSRNSKAHEIVVQTGARTEKDVLVTDGLKQGDTLLTNGIMSLKEGSPVRVSIKSGQS